MKKMKFFLVILLLFSLFVGSVSGIVLIEPTIGDRLNDGADCVDYDGIWHTRMKICETSDGRYWVTSVVSP